MAFFVVRNAFVHVFVVRNAFVHVGWYQHVPLRSADIAVGDVYVFDAILFAPAGCRLGKSGQSTFFRIVDFKDSREVCHLQDVPNRSLWVEQNQLPT